MSIRQAFKIYRRIDHPSSSTWAVHCDASSRNNQIGVGLVITCNDTLVAAKCIPLKGDITDSNVAESRAIIQAARYIHCHLATSHCLIYSDSQHCVESFNKSTPSPANLLAFNAWNIYSQQSSMSLLWAARSNPWASLADYIAMLASVTDDVLIYNTPKQLEVLLSSYECTRYSPGTAQ